MISLTNISIARTNRFMVSVVPPSLPGLSGGSFSNVYIESVDMPSITIATEDYEIDGKPSIKVPYKRTPAGTVTLSIRLEEDGKSRNLFKSWLDNIIVSQNKITYYRKYYNEIVGTVRIAQQDTRGTVKFGVTLLDAYPVTVDTIQYNWGEQNEYVRQSVTLAYFDEINSLI